MVDNLQNYNFFQSVRGLRTGQSTKERLQGNTEASTCLPGADTGQYGSW